jgi:glyoxylase I family protein
MERVQGIGGLFFRAGIRRPWHAGIEHLGVDPTPSHYDQSPWLQSAGPTAFALDTTDFLRPEQAGMINLRVDDLDAMVTPFRAAGIAVDVDPQVYPNGRFAGSHDPERNPVALWEPGGRVAAHPDGP